MSNRPILDGVTVVAVEQAVAAPFATRQLADLGARVVKIERPDIGDFARSYDETVHGQSSHFVWLNRGKESVALDLKQPEGVAVVQRLLAGADVFVENLAPGAAERLGLGPDDLAERHPHLITCSISGYGSDGPYRDKKAYDLLIQCEAGLVSITGSPDAPAKAGISIADIAGGTHAYSGVLSALLDRERTGVVRRVEVSLFEALGEWMGFPAYFTGYGGRELPRAGARHAAIQPYGPFRTGDGGVVQLGIQSNREFVTLCEEVLARPDLAGDPRFATNTLRCEHVDELTRLIEDGFSAYTADEVLARLDSARIANARLNTVAEFWRHPQLEARDRWREVGTPGGPVRALVPPATLSGVEPVMGDVPALGEHTDSVLAGLGLDPAEVTALRADGVLGDHPQTTRSTTAPPTADPPPDGEPQEELSS
ncbi:MAG: CaiB/BaiF CoA transferase family protein [Nocardioidaceae bacterium]